MDSLPEDAGGGPLARAVLARLRRDFHSSLTARADELSELADAVLSTDGPVRSLAGLSLAPGHRRGHGALYDAVNYGGFQNSATGLDLGFYAARSYSLRRPPRMARRLIRTCERSATG